MDQEEQGFPYEPDPRADIRIIWGRMIEEKERAEEHALLARAAWLQLSLPGPAIPTGARLSN